MIKALDVSTYSHFSVVQLLKLKDTSEISGNGNSDVLFCFTVVHTECVMGNVVINT